MAGAASTLRITTTTDARDAVAKIVAAAQEAQLATDVMSEEIRSFYWWDGAVQDDPETRLSFDTSAAFDQVVSVVGAAHNYDVPMIVGEDSNSRDLTVEHWKGVIHAGALATDLASALAASRLVACAQVAADGTLVVKTVKEAIDPVAARVTGTAAKAGVAAPGIAWAPILGNAPYLEWVTTETQVEACEGSR